MNREVRRKERAVRVVVERSRLGALCLAEAYEQVVPIVHRSPGRGEQGPGATRTRDRQVLPGGAP